MSGHKITGFLGVTPRTSKRLLPDMGAQIAQNIQLYSGEIKPIKKTALTHSPSVESTGAASTQHSADVPRRWWGY